MKNYVKLQLENLLSYLAHQLILSYSQFKQYAIIFQVFISYLPQFKVSILRILFQVFILSSKLNPFTCPLLKYTLTSSVKETIKHTQNIKYTIFDTIVDSIKDSSFIIRIHRG